MNETVNPKTFPKAYLNIDKATKDSKFTMASEVLTCSLLKTLAASKPSGNFLELGTGTGLSTSWILEGMDEKSTLITVDNDEKFLKIAQEHLGEDNRVELVLADGGEWIRDNSSLRFDYIFADTWDGKYLMLDEVLLMLRVGGLYIIDDMLPQENWPVGHDAKALKLVEVLENRPDLVLTKQCWASGIVIAVKR